MRESCIECVLKHIGQAAVLMHETVKGYEYHFVYVVGHLAEAEDEAIVDFPDIEQMIYKTRKAYMKGEPVDIDALAKEAYEVWKAIQ